MRTDLVGFEAEFMDKLKKDGVLFFSELVKLGKEHGLSQDQVDRIMEEAEMNGLGFIDIVFVRCDGEGHKHIMD